MRFYPILITLSAIAANCFGTAATVSTFTDLKNAVNARSTPIHLNASYFTMTSSIVINYDCVIDIVCNSDVVINGHDTGISYWYNFTFQDCNATVGNAAFDHSLTFTRGGVHGVVVQSLSAPTRITFNYCFFTYSNGNGLTIQSSTGANSSTVDVTCYNCQSNSNDYDGFSLYNVVGAHNTQWETMNLINCTATYNDPCGVVPPGNGAGDGATSHDVKQIINIVGGSYCNNGKMGGAPTGEGEMYAKGATFYGNNRVDPQGNVYVGGCKLTLEDCTFLNLTGTTSPLVHVFISNDPNNDVYIKNCTFKGQSSDIGGVYVEAIAGKCVIEGCTFSNNYQTLRETVRLWSGLSSAVVRDCVFYDVAKALDIEIPSAVIQNNVFDSVYQYAIASPNSEYTNQSATGHNLFFNVAGNKYFSGRDQSKLTDIQNLDPRFIDPNNANFGLNANSPCANAGQESVGNGLTNIGASQQQMISYLAPATLFADNFDNVLSVPVFPAPGQIANPLAQTGSWVQIQETNSSDIQVTNAHDPGLFNRGNYLGISSKGPELIRGNFVSPAGSSQLTEIVISFDFYLKSGLNNNFEFWLRNSSDLNSDAVVLHNQFSANGTVNVLSGAAWVSTGLTLSANQWNTATYVVHLDKGVYDIYIGNNSVIGLPFASPQTWGSQILFSAPASGTVLYLDNVYAEARPICAAWSPADLNHDCKVNFTDFILFAQLWLAN